MRKGRSTPGSAKDWLSRARGDLVLAKGPLPAGAFFEDLCFHAQQAAEKAIKAVYVHRKLAFKYTHDLEELVTGLRRDGVVIPEAIEEAIALTIYAWESRYPGVYEPVAPEEHREAVGMAEAVLSWAENETAKES